MGIFTRLFKRKNNQIPESVKNGLDVSSCAGERVRRFKDKYKKRNPVSIKNGLYYDNETFSGKFNKSNIIKNGFTH